MRVVIAPDSFKGTLHAALVAAAIGDGWLQIRPQDEIALLPQADGGEGTVDAIAATVPGSERIPVPGVTGPDGRPVAGEFLLLPDGSAVLELAQMSGIPLMAELDAGGSTTRGLGEVLRAAIERGVTRVTIGLGGSASTDGGAGALAALGLTLLDVADAPLPDGGISLAGLRRVDASKLIAPPPGGIELLTDVSAPLLGPAGAAAVFGPQKGADAELVTMLDAALANFADQLDDVADPSAPGTGAAGGSGFGLLAWAGLAGGASVSARIVPGAARIAELTGLLDALTTADVVITGEGRFDATSMTGKVVGHLLGVPTAARRIVVAGQLAAATQAGVLGIGLTDLAGSAAAAMAESARWLVQAGRQAAGSVR